MSVLLLWSDLVRSTTKQGEQQHQHKVPQPTGRTADPSSTAVHITPGRARANCLSDRCCKLRDTLFDGQVCWSCSAVSTGHTRPKAATSVLATQGIVIDHKGDSPTQKEGSRLTLGAHHSLYVSSSASIAVSFASSHDLRPPPRDPSRTSRRSLEQTMQIPDTQLSSRKG